MKSSSGKAMRAARVPLLMFAIVMIASCDPTVAFKPIVGRWLTYDVAAGTKADYMGRFYINADATFEAYFTDTLPAAYSYGTWSSDDAILTFTYEDLPDETYGYEMTDSETLLLTDTPSGAPLFWLERY